MRLKNLAVLLIILILQALPCFGIRQKKISAEKLQGEWVSLNGQLLIFSGHTFYFSWNRKFVTYKISNSSIVNESDKYGASVTILDASDISLQVSIIYGLDTLLKSIKFFNIKHNTPKELDFENVSYSSTECYGTCPVRSIEIGNTGMFYYLGEYYTKIKSLHQGNISQNYLSWLKYFLAQCPWDTLRKAYSKMVTDCSTEGFSVNFSDGKGYTINDYARSSPETTIRLLSYLSSIANLVDEGYIKSSITGEKQMFDAKLVLASDMSDSIKYLQTLDKLNNKLPEYPDGIDSVETIINASIYKGFGAYFYDNSISLFTFYVGTDGKVILNKKRALSEILVNIGLNYTGNRDSLSNAIYSDLKQAFSKLKTFKPGIYQGRPAIVPEFIDLKYH